MASPPFLLREFFHLSFLRLLSLKSAGRAYAVKGGICLRFYHGSPRLSEDIDLDASPGIRGDTLAKNVDTVLAAPPLMAHLAPRGVLRLSVTKPKQTAVTQRWKVALQTTYGSLGTKIEFSRRASEIPAVVGTPIPEILLNHGSVPFAARFYDGPEMARQKIRALAAPGRNAARDLFDLYHLFSFRGVGVDTLKGVETDTLESARKKVETFAFDDFSAQVLPYLTEEMIAAHKTPAAYRSLRESVLQILEQAGA